MSLSSVLETIFAGFALLPSREFAEEVIAYRNATSSISGPPLGLETNIPHLTLFQGMYDAGFDPAWSLDSMAAAGSNVRSRALTLTSEPGNWAFLHVEPARPLLVLHHQAAKASIAAGMTAPPAAPGMADWRPSEVAAFERFGYRYAMDAYLPHITLGTAAVINTDAWIRFVEDFAGIPVLFEQVLFYRAGERGVLAEVLDSRDLAGRRMANA